jgi:hypothetical protein
MPECQTSAGTPDLATCGEQGAGIEVQVFVVVVVVILRSRTSAG